nr:MULTISPECIES: transposase [Burkholderia]
MPGSTIGLLSTIGDVERFTSPEKLVSYFGLNPSVYQSGPTPTRRDHITKRERSYARASLVEAAWGATQAPDPRLCASVFLMSSLFAAAL